MPGAFSILKERLFRFLGKDIPAEGSLLFLGCGR